MSYPILQELVQSILSTLSPLGSNQQENPLQMRTWPQKFFHNSFSHEPCTSRYKDRSTPEKLLYRGTNFMLRYFAWHSKTPLAQKLQRIFWVFCSDDSLLPERFNTFGAFDVVWSLSFHCECQKLVKPARWVQRPSALLQVGEQLYKLTQFLFQKKHGLQSH